MQREDGWGCDVGTTYSNSRLDGSVVDPTIVKALPTKATTVVLKRSCKHELLQKKKGVVAIKTPNSVNLWRLEAE